MMRTAMLVLMVAAVTGLRGSAQQDKKKPEPPREAVVAGKTVTQWLAVLNDPKGSKLSAILALQDAGPEARKAAPGLVEALRGKDNDLQMLFAARALAKIGPDALPALEKALLQDKDVEVRGGAAMALGFMRGPARAAIPALTKALKDDETVVRVTAVRTLANLGPLAKTALPTLTGLLQDKVAEVRVAAAGALWKIGSNTKGLPVLIAELKRESGPSDAAVEALGEMGARAKDAEPALKERASKHVPSALALYRITGESLHALEVLAQQLKGKDESGRRTALVALGELAREEKAAQLLAMQLESASADLRREAACSLAAPEAKCGAVRAALEARLNDGDVTVRWWGALALAASGLDVRKQEEELLRALRVPLAVVPFKESATPDVLDVLGSERAGPALLRLVRKGSPRLRQEAARQLSYQNIDTQPILEQVLPLFEIDDRMARRHLAEALGRSGIEGLQALKGQLEGPQREWAARGLAYMGLPARSAGPALSRLLKDSDPGVRTQAALALWYAEGNVDDSLRALQLVMKDVDNKDRWEASEAMGVLCATARPPVQGLLEVMLKQVQDSDARVRTQAAKWLWRRVRPAAGDGSKIVPLVREGLTDRDTVVRQVSLEVLGELPVESKSGPLLLAALEDRDPIIRFTASEGLARGGAAAVPTLRDGLKHKNAKVRLGAVQALELMGAAASAARADLQALQKDGDASVRRAAELALRTLPAK